MVILRRFEEQDIKLEKKIKNKLSFKIFLSVAIVLIVTFSLCLIVIQYSLPVLYERELGLRRGRILDEIYLGIENMSMDELSELVIAFCSDNHANMTIYKYAYSERFTDNYEWVYSFNHNVWEEGTELNEEWIGFSHDKYGPLYRFEIETSLKPIQRVNDIIGSIIPYLLSLIIIISIGVAFIYSRYLAKPIVSISQISQKMRQLDWSERCNIERTDEIGDLAYNLNEMAEKLEKALSDLQEEMRQRNDLFTAVSHELKTPITVLKGELLGMLDNVGAYKNRDHYLQHAYETTESMERLVHEILTVSRIKGIQLDFHRLNISELVNKICQSHEDLATSRSVALICYCEEEIQGLADEMQLKKAISNIINNAIFHSPAGEIVTIQLVKVANMGVLTVENSGVQISMAELDQLFQPFYRTDKSRNRHTGGSGLGLFIVKSILDLHNFYYGIDNNEDSVVFTVKFPLA